MEISGDKIIFEGTPIATIDGGWPTLVERFSEALINGAESFRDEIESLKQQIENLEKELEEKE